MWIDGSNHVAVPQSKDDGSGKEFVPASTLTSKGQITIPHEIPHEIREELQLRKGHRLNFRVDPAGRLIVEPITQDVGKWKGIVRSSRKRPPSLYEIAKAIKDGCTKS